MTIIRQLISETDEAACLEVLAQLRTELTPERFRAALPRMKAEGYRMCLLEDEGAVRAVAGYRFIEMFATGRILYVDDLVVDSGQRSRGYGAALYAWLKQQAAAERCVGIELDSGTDRLAAHRFYATQGMANVALHFSAPCS